MRFLSANGQRKWKIVPFPVIGRETYCVGRANTHVVTLVERKSRFCVLVKVPGKDTATVVAAPIQHVGQLPAELRRSLTWDRGLEMAQHKIFTMATDMRVYFCDPQEVPGSVAQTKNTNAYCGNTRQRTPTCPGFRNRSWTGSSLRLNTRATTNSDFKPPADKLQASVASTP